MKLKIIIPIIVTILFISCSSSSHFFKKGNYDKAISIAVKKIRKEPTNEKEINVLVKSYRNANNQDNERIKYLKLEGRPDVWEEIYNLYSKLKSRQSIIQTVLPLKLNGKQVNFEHIDYDKDIISAKKKAAEYLYVHAKKLLDNNNVFDARIAYDEFIHIKDYYATYKDVDNMISLAKEKGTSKVYIESINHTHFKLPKDFVKEIIPKNLTPLSSKWVEYYTNRNLEYNYKVTSVLKSVMVSPELLKEERFEETKTIRDGWQYVLDNNGNVMKDSLGNDIKETKYTKISCMVVKTIQRREITLFSEIIYKDLYDNRIIKNIPIKTDWFIENAFTIANGDLRALSRENKELLDHKPILMPTDIEMIFNAGDIYRNVVKDELMKNKNVIK